MKWRWPDGPAPLGNKPPIGSPQYTFPLHRSSHSSVDRPDAPHAQQVHSCTFNRFYPSPPLQRRISRGTKSRIMLSGRFAAASAAAAAALPAETANWSSSRVRIYTPVRADYGKFALSVTRNILTTQDSVSCCCMIAAQGRAMSMQSQSYICFTALVTQTTQLSLHRRLVAATTHSFAEWRGHHDRQRAASHECIASGCQANKCCSGVCV